MMKLTEKKCVPCEGGVQPLKGDALLDLKQQVETSWIVINEHHLEHDYEFKDFQSALDFVNKVGEVAEKENHHPNIEFTWGKVKITIFTHAIDGLSENDFILAAKIDQIA